VQGVKTKKMRLKTIFGLIILTSCAIGKREVKYNEMASSPKVSVHADELIIKTENSKENSALSIYDIQATVDNTDKVILLKAYQAAGQEFKTEFRVKLKGIDKDNFADYKIYWVDPDNRRTEIKID
jgi:formyltetrahydrofolate synthetase